MIARHLCLYLSTLALALAPATGLRAGRIDAGTFELAVAGWLDFEGAAGTTAALDLGLGYFVMDGVLVGTQGSLHDDDVQTRLAASVSVEQHFETDTPWLPYLGLSAGILNARTDLSANGGTSSDSTTALVFGLSAGVKFYLTESLALDLGLRAALASDDVFISDGEPDNLDLSLRVGLRTFLY